MRAKALCLWVLLHSGCIHLYCEPDIVRKGEAPIRMLAESTEAAEIFRERLAKELLVTFYTKKSTYPFFVHHTRAYRISITAHWNDQSIKCDRNCDGMISMEEAEAYSRAEPEIPEARILRRRKLEVDDDE